MNILIVNPILFTPEKNFIPKVKSIKDTMIYNVCLGFMANGHQVVLAAAKEYEPVEKEDYDFEVLFFRSAFTRIFPPAILPLSFDFYKYLKSNHKKYDLIVSSEVFMFSSLFAAIICPSKTVIWQELMAHQNKFKKIPSKIWYNVIAPMFMRKIKCVPRSERAYAFISKYMPKVSNQCVEHGINLNKFSFSQIKKKQLIVVAQLIIRKNISSIIVKFRDLVADRKYADFQLVIAGKGELESELKRLTVDLNIDKNVHFAGFLSHAELNNRIAESMALLIDTKQDNNMVSIPESIVSGTPVVTNTVPSNAYTVGVNNLGIASDSWDKDALVEIIDNNANYVANCLQYREKLSNNYCARKIVDIYLKHV